MVINPKAISATNKNIGCCFKDYRLFCEFFCNKLGEKMCELFCVSKLKVSHTLNKQTFILNQYRSIFSTKKITSDTDHKTLKNRYN